MSAKSPSPSKMSPRAFRKNVLLGSLALSLAATTFISIYLVALLELSAEQWGHFGLVVGGLFPVLFGLVALTNTRIEAPVVQALRAEESGEGATPEQTVAAYRTLSRLPWYHAGAGILWWSLGGVLVAVAMRLAYPSLRTWAVGIIFIAATSGGFVSSVFHYFINRSICRDYLEEFGARIGDPAVRDRHVARISLRAKLMVSITGVSVVVVVFAMLLATSHSGAPVERNASRAQAGLLDVALATLEPGETPDTGIWTERARALGVAEHVLLVDVDSGEVVGGDASRLSQVELDTLRTADRGDGTGVDSSNAFAWASVPGTPLALVAATDWATLRGDVNGLAGMFGGLLAMAALISYGLAWLLSEDVGRRSQELKDAAARIAAGDLRTSIRMQSEDELGELAGAFAAMTEALRTAVSGVIQAADHVERAADDIAGIATVVSGEAQSQNEGVQRAATTMERINEQVAGISASAQELNTLVEESSSSILEMGAAGDELNDTAGVLSSQVEEVSTSIEQMVRSVKEVNTHTGSLSDAANDTSSSMEEMASALRAVDVLAQEAADLARRAMDASEGGRQTVQETISGMESIRAATEVAEQVIGGLVERSREIGSILDVIDDVADETNLLALNAAIIAAQAGEHGRAFSVVADEIKELADRVLSSTKEIGSLIRAVQVESENAVGAITQGARSVATGVERSHQAGSALEAITTASRESGQRIHEIVRSVKEQSKAASHVVEMMDRVNGGAEAIHRATGEQDRGNEVVFRSTVGMREVAQQLRATTEEQARGGARIRSSIDGVRDAAEAIDRALQGQTAACREVVSFLEQVSAGSAANDASSDRLSEATAALVGQAEALRQGVRQFVVED
jgi:methyl-accepting chemotaxis protein